MLFPCRKHPNSHTVSHKVERTESSSMGLCSYLSPISNIDFQLWALRGVRKTSILLKYSTFEGIFLIFLWAKEKNIYFLYNVLLKWEKCQCWQKTFLSNWHFCHFRSTWHYYCVSFLFRAEATLQGCRKRTAGEGSLRPPVFGRSVNPISTGGHILPTQYYEPPPQIFRPFDGPAL